MSPPRWRVARNRSGSESFRRLTPILFSYEASPWGRRSCCVVCPDARVTDHKKRWSAPRLIRLSHFDDFWQIGRTIFGLPATTIIRKRPENGLMKTYPLFFRLDFWHSAVVHVSAQHRAKEGRQDSPLFQRGGESPAARLQDCAAHSVVSGRD